ncbi:substrate-binding domain-containing protein [Salinibacterium soli]|uniref:Substrate-binding domain-containing protein n=1 Tax=Antiquaquibacter soli TaxID=3064523 RepID=A0ABT9BQU1_9MICO|nr:substrate-binding domain-containing protein [Protaetiibacter sp. WY-16]MDO7883382.1 substrate-binding domain-containing protein [Protaetiibacter sp. WY-16]
MIRIMKHRRLAVAATAVALGAFALSGCSSTNAGGGETGGNNLEADIAAGSVGTVDQFADMADICDTDAEAGSITLGVVDGGGTNSWSKTVLAEIESEAAKCPALSKVDYVAGSFDLETTTSGITSLAAKGTDIILVIPDAGPGEAHLPAIRQATQAGSIVINFASDPQGEAGVDYLDYTDQSPKFVGKTKAEWLVEQLGEEGGNVVFFGGPAGALVSTQEFEGVSEVFADNPQINFLSSEPIATNWDPAQAQQAMAGLLSQGEKIDAVIADYGASASGVIRAYEAAGISVPLITTTDDNSLSCGFADLKAANPAYELATVSSRTWIGRVALRKAVAAYLGGSDQEPSIYNLALFEDSTGSTAGTVTPEEACLPDAPADATPSTLLTPEEITALFS